LGPGLGSLDTWRRRKAALSSHSSLRTQ
jgi:hypothetical protein